MARIGRPPLSETEPSVHFSARLPQSLKAELEREGDGNLSLGVRRVLSEVGHLRRENKQLRYDLRLARALREAHETSEEIGESRLASRFHVDITPGNR